MRRSIVRAAAGRPQCSGVDVRGCARCAQRRWSGRWPPWQLIGGQRGANPRDAHRGCVHETAEGGDRRAPPGYACEIGTSMTCELKAPSDAGPQLRTSSATGEHARGPKPRELDPNRLPDHIDRLYRAAWALCGSRQDAEDLVQETVGNVLKRPRLLRDGN